MKASRSAAAITASDTINIVTGPTTGGIVVKTAGDYKLTMASGDVVTVNLAAGVLHRLLVSRVWASGSAATTGLVAFYED